MANEIRMRCSGKLSDPSIWEGGVTPGPHDVAILDGQTLIIDMPWKVKELRVHVRSWQWWDYVHTEGGVFPIKISNLVITGSKS